MAEKLSTGIEVLDRELDGGIPQGAIVVVYAPPISQSELILQELVQERNTLYISFERKTKDVEKHYSQDMVESDQLVIRRPSLESPVDNTRTALDQVTDKANIIVDTMDTLERVENRNRYIGFLNDLSRTIESTDSVGVLHCSKSKMEPEFRETTLQVADVVLDLTVDTDGDEVVNRLAIPKFRGGTALKDTIKLEMQDQVRVDTSRDIA